MKERLDQIPGKCAPWRTAVSVRPLKWILLGSFLALLLPSHGFGAAWWANPPSGQPAQMWSRVDYDPKMTDPFFESNEWSYSGGGKVPTSGMTREEDSPRLKHTAMCFSSSFGVRHQVKFCEARLLDGHMIDLLIHESNPAFRDALKVRIRNAEFTCQYWGDGIHTFTWTTTRQKLTLDKKAFRKGDVIKRRIDFECVAKVIDPKNIERWGKDPTTTIKVFGVFKTIVK